MRQEPFRRVHYSPYRGRHAVLCCFDLTDMVSFRNLKQWLHEIDRYAHENVTVVIVGCKADLTEKRVVDVETVLEFCGMPCSPPIAAALCIHTHGHTLPYAPPAA